MNVSLSGGTVAILIALVFTVLKLTDVIAWSWWWVLSPLWISALIGLTGLLLALAAAAAVALKARREGPGGMRDE